MDIEDEFLNAEQLEDVANLPQEHELAHIKFLSSTRRETRIDPENCQATLPEPQFALEGNFERAREAYRAMLTRKPNACYQTG